MRLQDCLKIAMCVGLLSMGPGPMAEELYVRNRPFRGYRSGNGRSRSSSPPTSRERRECVPPAQARR